MMKVAVIGGGPAGAMAAHRLGQAGIECALYEKNGAWEKPCGGGLPPKVREMVPEISEFDGPINSVTLGEFVSPSGLPVLLESRSPMWIVDRKDLGEYLLKLARSHESVTYRQETVKSVSAENGKVKVVAKEESVFDFVIGADGVRSKVGQTFGSTIPKEFITQCTGYFVEAKGEATATSWFLPVPGYLWAFPRKGIICVGGGSSEPRVEIGTYAGALVAKRFADRKVLSKWAAPIPFIRDPEFYDRPISGANWAVAGDAAGHVDALTGEGILYALLDGAAIAEGLIENKPALYEQRCRDTYIAQLKKASNLSGKFYRPEMMDKIFRLASRSKSMRRFLMDVMSDQPNYLEAGKRFSKISWRIAGEAIGGRD